MSVKLTVFLKSRFFKQYESDLERILIGRLPDNDLMIDNLGISRTHAEIIRKEGYYVVRDLGSNNGTIVNGRSVKSHILNQGDEIVLGKFMITFTSTEPVEDMLSSLGSEPDEETEDIVDHNLTMKMSTKSQVQNSTRIKAYLVCASKAGQKVHVLDKALTVLGKDTDADIRISGLFASRILAIILRDEQGFAFVNVSHRAKGTRVNGNLVKRHRLNNNDVINVKGMELVFKHGIPSALSMEISKKK